MRTFSSLFLSCGSSFRTPLRDQYVNPVKAGQQLFFVFSEFALPVWESREAWPPKPWPDWWGQLWPHVACFVELFFRHPITSSAACFQQCTHTRSAEKPAISSSWCSPYQYFCDTTSGFLSSQLVAFWSLDLQVITAWENEKVFQINTGTDLPHPPANSTKPTCS